MNKQPVALRLADELESYVGRPVCTEAAAELRRLFEHAHAQHSEIYGLRLQVRNLKALNQELLEALKETLRAHELGVFMAGSGLDKARASIAKAQGEQA